MRKYLSLGPFLFILITLFTLDVVNDFSYSNNSKAKKRSRNIASQSIANTCISQIKSFFFPVTWSKEKKDIAYDIILSGSKEVSRTISLGNRFLAPVKVTDKKILIIAEQNFKKATLFILKNLHTLKVNRKTAIKLNRILTNKLVPDKIRGNYKYRLNRPDSYLKEADSFVNGDPDNFYDWLDSEDAKKLFSRDPVIFAEIIHNNIVVLDSFPDGNGRLSRLLSDLALMKSNRAPAFYTSMEDYFETGNFLSNVSREVRIEYYKKIAKKGQEVMDSQIRYKELRESFSEKPHLVPKGFLENLQQF